MVRKNQLIALTLLLSVRLWSLEAPFKVSCPTQHDTFVLERVTEHLIRRHTSAVEDAYFRITRQGGEFLEAELVFEGYKVELNGQLTRPSNGVHLKLKQHAEGLYEVDFSYPKKEGVKGWSAKNCQMLQD